MDAPRSGKALLSRVVNPSPTTIFVSEFIGTALLLLLGIGVGCNQSLKSLSALAPAGCSRALAGASPSSLVPVLPGVAVRNQSRRHHCSGDVRLESTGWDVVPIYITAQVLGAMVGAILAYLLYKKQFDTNGDNTNTGGFGSTRPRQFLPSGGTSCPETIATFVLVYWVLESSPFVPGTGDSPPEFGNAALGYAGVAFTVIAVGASLGGATGYAINPARDFGPRFVYWLLLPEGQRKRKLELRVDRHSGTSDRWGARRRVV